MNLFRIGRMNLKQFSDGETVKWKFDLTAKIEFRCNEHHNLFSTREIYTEHSGWDRNETVRIAIERMLNGKYDANESISGADLCKCNPYKDPINVDFSGLEPAWRLFFEGLFKESNWTILNTLNPV